MVEFVKALPSTIDAASKNPLALIALLILIASWVIVSLKVYRNRELLKSLGRLPQKDRLKALEAEYGIVKIKGGMSAEQWLKQQSHTYIFYGFGMLCLVAVILVAIVVYSRPPKLTPQVQAVLDTSAPQLSEPKGIETPESKRPETVELAHNTSKRRSVAPNSSPTSGRVAATQFEVQNDWGPRMMAEDNTPPERTVLYESLDDNGATHIRYRLPYVDLLQRGGPVHGVSSMATFFKWRFPELSVIVNNRTQELMVLSLARFAILSSNVIEDPLLLFDDLSVNDLIIYNEGWGEVKNPVLDFSLSKILAENETSLFAPQTATVHLDNFDDKIRIPLQKYIPPALTRENIVAVSGKLSYGEANERRQLAFNTRVSLQVRPGAGIPATHEYEIMFHAGESGVTRNVSLQQEIGAGKADRFTVRLAADKTCRIVVHLELETAGGEMFDGGRFILDLFAPRKNR